MKSLKVSKTEYTANMLPATRREVFFDVIKLNKAKLLTLGVISFLFTMPFLILTIILSSYESYLLSANYSELITAEEALTDLTTFRNLISLIKCIFYVIFSVGLAGITRIIKLFVWEENVNLGADFLKGIKQNIKQFLLLGVLFSVIMFLCDFVENSFGGFFAGEIFINFGYVMKAVCLVFLAPLGAYLLTTCCVYELSFGQQIRYALLVFGKSFGKSLLAILCCLIVFVPQMVGAVISNTACQMIAYTLSGLLIPTILLGWFCFGFDRLDETINKSKYPHLVGRGTYKNENSENQK